MKRTRGSSLRLELLALPLLLVGLVACGAGGASTATRQTTTSPATATALNGLIAIGHSALTGENSDPSTSGAVPANSWATGTNPALHSIYERMLAAFPKLKGHVANTAIGGATADQLAGQARAALAMVPHPQLAIIQTIDNDIRCDGTDASHVAKFGDSLRAALQVIFEQSPHTQVLIVSPQGSPARELKLMAPLIASSAQVRQIYAGPAPCGMVDNHGNIVRANVASLTAIINAYAREQARVCGTYPTCQTDHGALATFNHDPSVVASDFNHLNIRGLKEVAAKEWPSVRSALAKNEPAK